MFPIETEEMMTLTTCEDGPLRTHQSIQTNERTINSLGCVRKLFPYVNNLEGPSRGIKNNNTELCFLQVRSI